MHMHSSTRWSDLGPKSATSRGGVTGTDMRAGEKGGFSPRNAILKHVIMVASCRELSSDNSEVTVPFDRLRRLHTTIPSTDEPLRVKIRERPHMSGRIQYTRTPVYIQLRMSEPRSAARYLILRLDDKMQPHSISSFQSAFSSPSHPKIKCFVIS